MRAAFDARMVCKPVWLRTRVSRTWASPDRRDDLEDRLIRENWGPFRNRENVPGEAEAAQVVEQALGKQSEQPQIGDVVRTEAEVFDFSQ